MCTVRHALGMKQCIAKVSVSAELTQRWPNQHTTFLTELVVTQVQLLQPKITLQKDEFRYIRMYACADKTDDCPCLLVPTLNSHSHLYQLRNS